MTTEIKTENPPSYNDVLHDDARHVGIEITFNFSRSCRSDDKIGVQSLLKFSKIYFRDHFKEFLDDISEKINGNEREKKKNKYSIRIDYSYDIEIFPYEELFHSDMKKYKNELLNKQISMLRENNDICKILYDEYIGNECSVSNYHRVNFEYKKKDNKICVSLS